MNPERLRKLEALLKRVQTNAGAPRPRTANGATAAALEVEPTSPLALASAAEEVAGDALVDENELLDAVDEAPASSRRIAGSMNEALAGAADQLEPPPKTVPPESGPEPLHGRDLELSQSIPSPKPGGGGPTTEQLGQTVALEEGSRDSLELDEPLSESAVAQQREPSLLEAELPSGAGTYSKDLASPPGAREELARVRLGEVRAEVVARPIISTNVVEFLQAQNQRQPQSFAGWLDETLSLGNV